MYLTHLFSVAAQERGHGGKAVDRFQWNSNTEVQGLPDTETGDSNS